MKIVCVTNALDAHHNKANGVRVCEALRSLGHEAIRLDHFQAIKRERLAGADLILAFGTLLSAERKTSGLFDTIRKAKPSGAPFAFWYFDLVHPKMLNSPWKYPALIKIVPMLDWLITTDHSHPWENHAKRYLHLFQGVDPADFDFPVAPPEPRQWDVIFTGGFDGVFAERLKAIRYLRAKGISVADFGRSSKHRIFGKDFFDAHQRARIVFVPKPPMPARNGYWSNRVFLAAATGTPCAVGYTENIERFYEPEREAVFFNTLESLAQKIFWLKADPIERERIGSAGRARTMLDHTYAKRAASLLEAIFGGENEKAKAGA